MKANRNFRKFAVVMVLVLGMFTGCESTDGGGSSQVSGSFYYGVGFYDPWYYGDYHDDVIISPPPGMNNPRPSHPIAMPPSMPSMPRPSPRR